MSVISHDCDDDQSYILVARTNTTRVLSQLLKAVHFKERAIVFASADGLKVTVEESKCVQACAFIQADVFNSYQITEESVTFEISVAAMLGCIDLLDTAFASELAYDEQQHIAGGIIQRGLNSSLEEDGVVTSCSIQTHEPQDVLNFNFTDANVVNKIIMQSECLKEALSDIDSFSGVIEILLSPDRPHFRLTSFGPSCTCHMECPSDSDVVDIFNCTQTQANRYKSSLIKTCTVALNMSQKVSIRTNEQGFICFQFMIPTEDGHICFFDHYCSPEEDAVDDMENLKLYN